MGKRTNNDEKNIYIGESYYSHNAHNKHIISVMEGRSFSTYILNYIGWKNQQNILCMTCMFVG